MKISHPYPFNVTNTFIVKKVEDAVNSFFGEWIEKLAAKPILLAEMETAATEAGRELTRLLLAGTLAAKSVQEGIATAANQVRAEFDKPLRKVADRIVNVQFQCNMTIGITSQYCVPRKSHGVPGMHVEGRRVLGSTWRLPRWASWRGSLQVFAVRSAGRPCCCQALTLRPRR